MTQQKNEYIMSVSV